MSRREHMLALAAFRVAAFAPELWQDAIGLMAKATGSRCAELMGWMAPGQVPLHLVTDGLRKSWQEWFELGGSDPTVNPLIRAGTANPAMHTILDTKVLPLDTRKKHQLWAEFFEPCDIPHVGTVVLQKGPDCSLVTSVARSAREGPLEGEQLRVFEDCARVASEATALSSALGARASDLLVGGLETVGEAAMAINRFGRVAALTQAAERLLASRKWFDISEGNFRCRSDHDSARFDAAVKRAFHDNTMQSVCFRGASGALDIRLFPLPTHVEIGFGARLLAILTEVSDIACLSAAEREVYAMLRRGLRPNEIAEVRKVSLETVRTQAKAIYAKLGVRDQLELVIRR